MGTNVIVPNLCENGCARPTWDGKKEKETGLGFCSLDCYEDYYIMQENQKAGSVCGAAPCNRPGCQNPSYSGDPGDFCSLECKELFEEQERTAEAEAPVVEIPGAAADGGGCDVDE